MCMDHACTRVYALVAVSCDHMITTHHLSSPASSSPTSSSDAPFLVFIATFLMGFFVLGPFRDAHFLRSRTLRRSMSRHSGDTPTHPPSSSCPSQHRRRCPPHHCPTPGPSPHQMIITIWNRHQWRCRQLMWAEKKNRCAFSLLWYLTMSHSSPAPNNQLSLKRTQSAAVAPSGPQTKKKKTAPSIVVDSSTPSPIEIPSSPQEVQLDSEIDGRPKRLHPRSTHIAGTGRSTEAVDVWAFFERDLLTKKSTCKLCQ